MDPEAGEVLAGKYELLELAGEGGMARVYRAMTLGAAGFRREVAVKRIRSALSDKPEFVEMFVEEARVVSSLQHPNVVQIHDFDQDEGGAYFLVLEWVEGLNLLDWSVAHRRAEVPTPWPLVAAIGIELLKALTAAHERTNHRGEISPVYHRDVTPQNVLVTTGGFVKLADFGLARAMDRARITQPDMVKGKISYLAPELTRGADPSPQSDLFGVGVVLWELLAGEKLFKGENPLETIRAIRAGGVPRVDARRADVPAELGRVLERALATDPARRFSSARSMVRALANLLRVTPSSTSAEVLGKSIVEARTWLARHAAVEGEGASHEDERRRASPSVTVLDRDDDAHVLLTRRRPAKPRAEA
jgi:serine/threonine-protein kinase